MTETPITICPPGYAIGYFPHGSTNEFDAIKEDILRVSLGRIGSRGQQEFAYKMESAKEKTRQARTPWVKWEARWS